MTRWQDDRGMSTNEVFKALSDPTRREILRALVRGEQSAGELAEQFDMSKPSVSHHFSLLKDADLIRSRRDGQRILYSLNTTVLEDLATWMWDLFGVMTPRDSATSVRRKGKA
jgi:DNA-binding transcriptional ArsR family regulator